MSRVCVEEVCDVLSFFCRHLDAFVVCPFGEGRVYTSPKVTDHTVYLYKAQMFETGMYDADHQRMAKFIPGFNFTDISGGALRVLGIVNKSGSLQELEEIAEKKEKFANYFFREVLMKAIGKLPATTRTRKHNLIHSAQDLPEYFRLYNEDIALLSSAITAVQRSLPSNAPYRFYFLFVKLGQQLTLAHNMRSDFFTDIISSPARVDSSCIHIATTFTHTSPNFSIFWNLLSPTSLYTGQDVKKYPFFGLSQVGNVTVKTPTNSAPFFTAWHPTAQQCSRITYVQFYSPLTKSFSSKPFEDHPFLLTLMLGRDYVRSNSTFRKVWLAAEMDGDFTALREAIQLHLDPASARCEVVITGSDLAELVRVDLSQLAENIKNAGLLLQVNNSRL